LQAEAAARVLERDLGIRPDIDFVSSPLPRARATMELIRLTLGLPATGYRMEPRINEINMGSWDGFTHEEARLLDPAFFAARKADKWNVRLPGGESYTDVAARATDWVKSLERDTFAVTHGAFTRILRWLFSSMTDQEFAKLDEPNGVVFRVRGQSVLRLHSP
jgi:probable phosphoglycerate mutase